MERELRELGLTDNETKIYLVLLRNGQLNPTSLAEKTGLHRSYVYDACERLLERGIIGVTLVNGKKQFQPADPKNLREGIELKLRTVNTILPTLTTLYKEKMGDSAVELQRGARVYQTLIKELAASIRKNDEILIIGVDEKMLSAVEPIYLKQYFRILSERNAKERVIISKGSKQLREKNLSYGEIDREYIGDIITIVHQNCTYFFVVGEPHKLIKINDEMVADAHRRQFEVLWRMTKSKREVRTHDFRL